MVVGPEEGEGILSAPAPGRGDYTLLSGQRVAWAVVTGRASSGWRHPMPACNANHLLLQCSSLSVSNVPRFFFGDPGPRNLERYGGSSKCDLEAERISRMVVMWQLEQFSFFFRSFGSSLTILRQQISGFGPDVAGEGVWDEMPLHTGRKCHYAW